MRTGPNQDVVVPFLQGLDLLIGIPSLAQEEFKGIIGHILLVSHPKNFFHISINPHLLRHTAAEIIDIQRDLSRKGRSDKSGIILLKNSANDVGQCALVK